MTDLPVTWAAIPVGRTSVDLGTKWLTVLESALPSVPSVVVSEEPVVLLNPRHRGAAGIAANFTGNREYVNIYIVQARAS